MRRSRRPASVVVIAFVVGAVMLLGSSAQACGMMLAVPPDSTVEYDKTSKFLVTYENGVERLVVDLSLRGDAKSFGTVLALPSRPAVQEAPEELFTDLAAYTRPRPRERDFVGEMEVGLGGSFGLSTSGSGVTVIEEKRIGDFDVTVLGATDAGALTAWLEARDFVIRQRDSSNLARVVQRGGATFVAISLDTGRAPGTKEMREYDTPPIAFAFRTTQPIIPLQLAADEDPGRQFTLYTISDTPLIVPGAGLAFSERLPAQVPRDDFDALAVYALPKAWLVRLEFMVAPARISEDLRLIPWASPSKQRVRFGEDLQFLMAHAVQQDAGVYIPKPRTNFFGGNDVRLAIYESEYVFIDYVRRTWWEKYDKVVKELSIGLLVLLIHIATAFALRKLARHTGSARYRWLAWIPVVNADLVRRMAGKRWWWGIGSAFGFLTPAVYARVMDASWYWRRQFGEIDIIAISVTILFFLLFITQCVLWVRLWIALARTFARGRSWGATMAIPFVGVIPLIMFTGIVTRNASATPTSPPSPQATPMDPIPSSAAR